MKQPSTKAEFDAILAEAAAAGKAVVVDFTATWCGPCQRIAPLYAQLASEFPQAEFIKVDVDENQETAQACQVSSAPPKWLSICLGRTFHNFRGPLHEPQITKSRNGI